MPDPKIIDPSAELALEDITIGPRLRRVSEAGVESLIASITELGVMKDPIHVRRVRHRDNALVLLAGGHRMEAARRMGWTTINAKVWECNDDQARLVEIDDNLAGAEMDALDTARFLARRKEVYERLHPETRNGAKGLAAIQGVQTDTMSVWSFVKTTAEKFGQSERNIRRLVAAGAVLDDDSYNDLRAAPAPVTLKDLSVLAKVTRDERHSVIELLSAGGAKNAMDALRQHKAQGAVPLAHKDPIEVEKTKMLNAWHGSKKAAQRRFVAMVAPELRAMLDDLEAAEAQEPSDAAAQVVSFQRGGTAR